MSKYTIGSPIKTRLSREYDPHQGGSLTIAQASVARRIIRSMNRTEANPTSARGTPLIASLEGYTYVETKAGEIIIGKNRKSFRAEGSSVGEIVCYAVKHGYFNPNNGVEGGFPEDEHPFGAGQEMSGDGEGEGEQSYGGDDDAGQEFGEGGQDAMEAEGAPQGGSEPEPEHPLDELIRRLNEARDYLESSDEVTDSVSNRAFIDGARMVAKGIPVDGVMWAWAMHWPETARASLGITEFDPASMSAGEDGKHPYYEYVKALIEADVAPFLIGPTQAGKSYVVKQVARDLGLPYGEVPLVGGASPSWLLGAHTPDGFVEMQFTETYQNGGVFNFEEIDAASPNLIVVLNNALANDELRNPRTGETIKRHPDFRAAATGNTSGYGATSEYTGRARQDRSVLERLRLGRIMFGYDNDLQVALARSSYEEAGGVPLGGDEEA